MEGLLLQVVNMISAIYNCQRQATRCCRNHTYLIERRRNFKIEMLWKVKLISIHFLVWLWLQLEKLIAIMIRGGLKTALEKVHTEHGVNFQNNLHKSIPNQWNWKVFWVNVQHYCFPQVLQDAIQHKNYLPLIYIDWCLGAFWVHNLIPEDKTDHL